MHLIQLTIYAIILANLGTASGRYIFVSMEERTNATGVVKKDWCTDVNSFKNIIGITLYKCGEECMRRSRCRSVLYHKEMRFCRLRNETIVTPQHTETLYEECWSSDISTWDDSVLGRCAGGPCNDKSRCYLDLYQINRCEVTECLEPPHKPDTHLASMTSDIGASNAYFCKKSFIRIGNASISCTKTGEWTSSNVTCHPR